MSPLSLTRVALCEGAECRHKQRTDLHFQGRKKSVCVIIYVCVFGEEYFKNYNKMLSLIRKMDSPAHAGNPKSVLT